jgi:hypothetical protein
VPRHKRAKNKKSEVIKKKRKNKKKRNNKMHRGRRRVPFPVAIASTPPSFSSVPLLLSPPASTSTYHNEGSDAYYCRSHYSFYMNGEGHQIGLFALGPKFLDFSCLAFFIFSLFFSRGTSKNFSFGIAIENGFWPLVIADNLIMIL